MISVVGEGKDVSGYVWIEMEVLEGIVEEDRHVG